MSTRTWHKHVARLLFLGVLCGATGLVTPAAMAAPAVALNAEQRALIWKLTADKALAVANERRLAAEEQAALNQRLDCRWTRGPA